MTYMDKYNLVKRVNNLNKNSFLHPISVTPEGLFNHPINKVNIIWSVMVINQSVKNNQVFRSLRCLCNSFSWCLISMDFLI